MKLSMGLIHWFRFGGVQDCQLCSQGETDDYICSLCRESNAERAEVGMELARRRFNSSSLTKKNETRKSYKDAVEDMAKDISSRIDTVSRFAYTGNYVHTPFEYDLDSDLPF
jgi:hypothetical protein